LILIHQSNFLIPIFRLKQFTSSSSLYHIIFLSLHFFKHKALSIYPFHPVALTFHFYINFRDFLSKVKPIEIFFTFLSLFFVELFELMIGSLPIDTVFLF